MSYNINRRKFLSTSAMGLAGASGLLGQMVQNKAWAADKTGYKALVLVFLAGGMDHGDTILPTDQPSYDKLRAVRTELFDSHYKVDKDNASPRKLSNIPQINPSNIDDYKIYQDDGNLDYERKFGLPPVFKDSTFGDGIYEMFENAEAAIIGNVGPLLAPADRENYENFRVPTPPRLFSHNDQESTWMSLGTEGTVAGWGGKFADAILDDVNDDSIDPAFITLTSGNNDVFLASLKGQQFRTQEPKAKGLKILETTKLIGTKTYFNRTTEKYNDVRTEVANYYDKVNFSAEEANIFGRDIAEAVVSGLEKGALYNSSNSTVPDTTKDINKDNPVFPNTEVGEKLRKTARAIEIRADLETRGKTSIPRQIFFVKMGGYDTHNGQVDGLGTLHKNLNDGLAAFRALMIQLGQWDNVTVFTGSDFGRTGTDNGDGTDHGWGGHHFVMGGSVKGKKIYGEIPPLEWDLNIPDKKRFKGNRVTSKKGRLIPTLAIEEYAATLGTWFGLSDDELKVIFPLLTKKNEDDTDMFPNMNLGFMKAP